MGRFRKPFVFSQITSFYRKAPVACARRRQALSLARCLPASFPAPAARRNTFRHTQHVLLAFRLRIIFQNAADLRGACPAEIRGSVHSEYPSRAAVYHAFTAALRLLRRDHRRHRLQIQPQWLGKFLIEIGGTSTLSGQGGSPLFRLLFSNAPPARSPSVPASPPAERGGRIPSKRLPEQGKAKERRRVSPSLTDPLRLPCIVVYFVKIIRHR